MKHNFNTLLEELTKYILKQEQEALKKGEKYNLFKVIHMTSNETSVHSAFIADLLNPKGLHGQGNLFLDSFLSVIKNYNYNFITDGCHVEIEKYIGDKSDSTGGRLDIILTNRQGQAIIIENKIYAEDQQAQMLRYYNYAEKTHRNKYILLYLSLDGLVHDTEKTTQNKICEGKHFYTISYKNEIIKWLEDCVSKSNHIPIVSYGITHYLNLVKKITNMDINDSHKTELCNVILSNTDYVRNILNYESALKKAKDELYKKFWQELLIAIEARNLGCPIFLVSETKKENHIYGATKDLMLKLSRGYKNSEDRKNRSYDYRFGIAIPIASFEGKELMLGFIIDGTISYRIFVKRGNNIINKNDKNICTRFTELSKNTELSSNECGWVKSTTYYLIARYPFNDTHNFNMGKPTAQTLEKLASMKDCVNDIVNEALEYRSLILSFIKEEPTFDIDR